MVAAERSVACYTVLSFVFLIPFSFRMLATGVDGGSDFITKKRKENGVHDHRAGGQTYIAVKITQLHFRK